MNKRPNVLFFCVDQMRFDHSTPYGNSKVNTPNLERIANKGVVFERAYAASPSCMPARASMFTGLLARDHGLRLNCQRMRDDLPMLAGELSKAGYYTHSAGKLHITPWNPRLDEFDANYPECMDFWNQGKINEIPAGYCGFDSIDFVGGHGNYIYGNYIEWLKGKGGDPANVLPDNAIEIPEGVPQSYVMNMPQELHYNRYISDSTISAIEKCTKEDKPFFIWCSYPDPHHPIAPIKPYYDMYDIDDIELPATSEGEIERLPEFYKKIINEHTSTCSMSDDQIKKMIAMTYGMITHIDREIGRVIDELEANGQLENTIIIFTSDHGDMMGDHSLLWKGIYAYKGTNQIPLIVSAPKCETKKSDAIISQIDFFPTILDYCKVETAQVKWDKKRKEFPFQTEVYKQANMYPGKSFKPIIDGDLEQISDCAVIESDDVLTGLHSLSLVTDDYRITTYSSIDEGELFDIKNDPKELDNLWDKPEYETIKLKLIRKLLNEYRERTPFYPPVAWNS